MKKIKYILGLILLIVFISCSKEKNDNQYLQISTDKLSYSSNEMVCVNIANHYKTELGYYICSSYKGVSPLILKYEDNNWIAYWSPVCNGYASYCCGILESQNNYKDTLNITFGKGTYKIEYSFIVEHGEGYQSFFSNEFEVE